MAKVKHGAPSARRWVQILCVGVASCALTACATTSEGRAPPTHCSRGSARNANPNGSIFLQATANAAPDASGQREVEVMVFGKDGEAKPADPAETVVPAPQSEAVTPPAAPAGRPLSMRGGMVPLQTQYGSC